MFDHLVMLALDGCKGAKIWITRTGSYHEKKSGEAYRRILRENKGLMEWAAKVDLEQHGVVVPICGPGEFNFGDRYLALTGFPYRFGKAGSGEITALTAETLALLSEGEIDEVLSGLAILDGPAAVWLSEHGHADDIGVDARPWSGRTIQAHEFSDGSRQPGIRTIALADLTNSRDGARTLTRLLHRDAMGGELVFEAPGSLLYENGRGGRILVLAQPIPAQATSYFSAQFFSEGYKAQMAAWLKALAGEMPGGVNYLGVGPVTCLSGTTKEGEEIVVLNALDLDGDSEPELSFPCVPTKIERLCGDGGWESVAFESAPDGSAVKLHSPVAVQHPAIFRWE